MNNKILILSLIPIISFSSLKCNLYNNINCKYTENLVSLKMDNDKLYRAYLFADKDNILIEDNVDASLPLASLTKMMTAMVVLDNIDNLDIDVTVTKKASKIPYGVRLDQGDQYTVLELLKIMLIKSSNSAAQTLADYVCDTDFAQLMNNKAKEIGLKNTKYYTPHGLPPKYTNTKMDISTARDIYKLSKYMMEHYPLLKEIVQIRNEEVAGFNLVNTNNLLLKMPNVKGIKTGFHNESKYNISVYYEENGREFYEIILGTQNVMQREVITRAVIDDMKGVR